MYAWLFSQWWHRCDQIMVKWCLISIPSGCMISQQLDLVGLIPSLGHAEFSNSLLKSLFYRLAIINQAHSAFIFPATTKQLFIFICIFSEFPHLELSIRIFWLHSCLSAAQHEYTINLVARSSSHTLHFLSPLSSSYRTFKK